MYLIDEQHIVRLQRGEHTGQITRLVEHGARADLKADAQLIGDDIRQGGLSQPGSNAVKPFSNATPDTPLSPSMLLPSSGGNQPHNNQQPYLAVNFCVALQGVFPAFD